MKKQLVFISFISLFFGSFISPISASSIRTDGYYDDDDRYYDGYSRGGDEYWTGPGWYNGIWFNNREQYARHSYGRRSRSYPRGYYHPRYRDGYRDGYYGGYRGYRYY